MRGHCIFLGADRPSGFMHLPAAPVTGHSSRVTPRARTGPHPAKRRIWRDATLPRHRAVPPFGGGVPVEPWVGYLVPTKAPGPQMHTIPVPESD